MADKTAEEMLEAVQEGMQNEPEMFLTKVPEGTKFVVVDLHNEDPTWLTEAPTDEQKAEDGEYWDAEGGEPLPILEVSEGDKYYLWDPRNANYQLGGDDFLKEQYESYGGDLEHVDIDVDDDDDQDDDDQDD